MQEQRSLIPQPITGSGCENWADRSHMQSRGQSLCAGGIGREKWKYLISDDMAKPRYEVTSYLGAYLLTY